MWITETQVQCSELCAEIRDVCRDGLQGVLKVGEEFAVRMDRKR